MLNALIVEDVAETGSWLQNLLQEAFPDVTTHVCCDCNSFRQKITYDIHYNLVLLDINLPDGNGLDLIPLVFQKSPDAYVIVSTIFDDEDHILKALQRGAKGYLLKDSSESVFIQKLRGILIGDPPLSPGIARKILHHFNQGNLLPTTASDAPDNVNEQKYLQQTDSILSPRETETLILIAKGFTRKETAKLLGLSVNTVARYVRDVYQKLNISSQAEAAIEACRLGLVSAD